VVFRPTHPSEKYELVKVTWNDDMPNNMEKNMFQTTNQLKTCVFVWGLNI